MPVRRFLGRLLLGGLVYTCLQPWAYDSQRMVDAARQLGPRAEAGARLLDEMLVRTSRADEPTRIRVVNQFFNDNITFGDDLAIWGQQDYWASPLEMLNKGAGDCEDYAIAKYLTLTALSVPVAKLRMVYVRAWQESIGARGVAHMVLAYYPSPDAEPMILDNLVPEVRPASQRPDLKPVFSFNGEGLWQGVGAQRVADDAQARLSRWREVLAKARAEGF